MTDRETGRTAAIKGGRMYEDFKYSMDKQAQGSGPAIKQGPGRPCRTAANFREEMEMNLRIGAKSPVYSTRHTSKTAEHSSKTSFARMMADEKESINDGSAADCKIPGTPPEKADPVIRDTVTISRNLLEAEAVLAGPDPLSTDYTEPVKKTPLTERLEALRQKIEGMDFTGKSDEEICKSIVDAYEDEFGFIGVLAYTDRETYNEIRQAEIRTISGIASGYSDDLYYRAMGYDKMTDAEKIAAIKERVGGSSYYHQYATLAEFQRAKVITYNQCMTIFRALSRSAKMEYCAQHGLNYLRWSYPSEFGDDCSEEVMKLREQSFMAWAAKTDVTWLEIFESVHEYPALWEWERNNFFKEVEEVAKLLAGSDNG